MKFAAKKARLEQAIFAPVAITKEGAKAIMDDLRSGDEAKVRSANEQIELAVKSPTDALSGQFNAITERNKAVNSTVMPMMGRVVEVFINQFGDELESLDDSWMSYLAVDVLTGSFKGTIFEIINKVVAHPIADSTDPIPFSKYKASTWENILPEYYGAAVAIEREILDNDPLSSLNNIVIAIRIALLKKKTEVAFERINAGIALAIAAGYVTAYTASNLAKTLNSAYLTLIERNQGKGYGLTGQTNTVLTGYEGHRSLVEPVFEITTNSLINNPNGTIRTRYPMTRQYSFYFEDDLGDSGSKMALILPFRRMRLGNFRTQKIESETKIDTNSQNTYGREAYNFLIDETQIQVVTIE